MAEYRNETKGARYIHLTGGVRLLVEAGATMEADEARVVRIGPGIVLDKRTKVAKAPAKAVAAVTGARKTAPRKRKAPAKAKTAAKA